MIKLSRALEGRQQDEEETKGGEEVILSWRRFGGWGVKQETAGILLVPWELNLQPPNLPLALWSWT